MARTEKKEKGGERGEKEREKERKDGREGRRRSALYLPWMHIRWRMDS